MERRERHREAEAINDRAAREKRNLYPDEQKRWGAFEAEDDKLKDEIRSLERTLGHNPLTRTQITPPTTVAGQDPSGPTLGREQRMLDWQAGRGGRGEFTPLEADEFSVGRAIRGMVTGRWDGADLERRALSEGVDSAGGFLVPELLSSKTIDLVRKKARVLEAGAQTLPLGSDSVSLPRLATGVVGTWKAENAPVTESQPVFERVTFRPKTLAVLTKLSYELFEDLTAEGAELIENELVASLSLELDRAALRGTGTGQEPTGLRNQAGVTIQSLGVNGATPTYGSLMTAVTSVLGANLDPTAIVLASRTAQQLASLADTTNQPLQPPAPVAALPRFVTNQLPINLTQGTSVDTSEIFVGDFSQLIVGIRPHVRIEVSRADAGPFGGVQFKADTSASISTMSVNLLAYLRADVQLLHPEAFVAITGARP